MVAEGSALSAAWVEVAPAGDVPPGEHRVYEVDARFVVVYNIGGELYAIEDVCTHDGNPLSDGPVEDHEVICPRHGARFRNLCCLSATAGCCFVYAARTMKRTSRRFLPSGGICPCK